VSPSGNFIRSARRKIAIGGLLPPEDQQLRALDRQVTSRSNTILLERRRTAAPISHSLNSGRGTASEFSAAARSLTAIRGGQKPHYCFEATNWRTKAIIF
jgi:hypothetical protein